MSETCKNREKAAGDGAKAVEVRDLPACLQQRIDSIQKEPRWNPPAEVNEYIYKGKQVFLFNSDCCDFFNPLVDSNCNYICSPSGGITGQGDLTCRDFDSLSKHVRLVWRDKREAASF
jgi:hypothetical protein